ncbi:Aste57867_2601 [Aphanomyces stellatus]|uniref:Aste57867_2601 protein n=1 Tax=Aphanomyces stellatus TaxID=120398 RepID=A0A485KDK8_9STRA|nr:hypothetical protein As57867_002594 [Aphanomyces stellatus]VFT79797.1 Aste57867_2601 [Aphanomyces stellatus]
MHIGPSGIAMMTRRQAETLRQQKYRAAKRAEFKLLEAELRYLEDYLARLRVDPHATRVVTVTRQNPYALALQVLKQHNKSLHEQVERRAKLAQLLSMWVASQRPQPCVRSQATWIQTTLLADPDARRHGHEWLSARVYHTALAAISSHPFGGEIDDYFRVQVHTTIDDDDDHANIAATEIHLQTTCFAPYQEIAKALWTLFHGIYFDTTAMASCAAIEQVHDHLVYHQSQNRGFGARVNRVMGQFEDPNRIVLTSSLVADDERFPVPQDELRAHGFGWISLERVTDSITLTRFSMLQFAPFNARGTASLEDIGRIYGKSAHGIEHRDSYIQHVRAAIETSTVQMRQALHTTLRQMIRESRQEAAAQQEQNYAATPS